jgi:hypothetical protein
VLRRDLRGPQRDCDCSISANALSPFGPQKIPGY